MVRLALPQGGGDRHRDLHGIAIPLDTLDHRRLQREIGAGDGVDRAQQTQAIVERRIDLEDQQQAGGVQADAAPGAFVEDGVCGSGVGNGRHRRALQRVENSNDCIKERLSGKQVVDRQ